MAKKSDEKKTKDQGHGIPKQSQDFIKATLPSMLNLGGVLGNVQEQMAGEKERDHKRQMECLLTDAAVKIVVAYIAAGVEIKESPSVAFLHTQYNRYKPTVAEDPAPMEKKD